MRWSDTTAVVTGATRGIGRAVVGELVGRGARVGCIARSDSDLDALRRDFGAGRVEVARADVSVRTELDDALGVLHEALGPADVLVNNAGIGHYGAVLGLDPGAAELVMQVNYLGTVYATTALLPGMVERRRGHIVNLASIAGRLRAPFEAAYAASKFAVVGFSEALATEVAPFDVRVSLVNPGPVTTTFFESRGHPYLRNHPRPVSAERVAKAVIGVLENGRFERTVPRALGAGVVVRHLLPGFYVAGTRRAFRSELARLTSEYPGP